MKFGYEDLKVWNRSFNFADQIIDLVEDLDSKRKHFRLIEQIESAVVSIAINIAEGKGRYSKKEFIHFAYIARGSLYETMTLLEIFNRRKWIVNKRFEKIKDEAKELVSMIKGLINALSK